MIDLSHDRLMVLFEISHRINRISNLQRLLDEILNSAISNIGAERGLLILTDESGAAGDKDMHIGFAASMISLGAHPMMGTDHLPHRAPGRRQDRSWPSYLIF